MEEISRKVRNGSLCPARRKPERAGKVPRRYAHMKFEDLREVLSPTCPLRSPRILWLKAGEKVGEILAPSK